MSTKKPTRSKFVSLELEVQLAAFIIRRAPEIAVLVKPQWFSSLPIRSVVEYAKRHRIVLASSSALLALKKEHLLIGDESVYKAALQRLFSVRVSSLTIKSARLLAEQVKELAESREVFAELRSIVKEVKTFNLRQAKSKLRKLSIHTEIEDTSKSAEWVEDFEHRVDVVKQNKERADASESGVSGIPTGIIRLDQITGGLVQGEFGVVIGRTGLGKTVFLVSAAVHAYVNGFNVAVFTGELSKDQYAFRIDAHLAEIPGELFRSGDLKEGHWKTWQKTIEQFHLTQENFLHISEFSRNFSVEEIEAEAYRIQEKHEKAVDLVIIDYLNIMSPSGRGHSGGREWGSQADVVWDVKSFTETFNGGVSLWTAGQIKSESVTSDNLSAEDTKYAGAIAETAPLIVGLVQTEEDVLEKRMQTQILKVRNAARPTKVIYLHPNLQLSRIHQAILHKKDLMELEDDFVEPKKKRHARGRTKRIE